MNQTKTMSREKISILTIEESDTQGKWIADSLRAVAPADCEMKSFRNLTSVREELSRSKWDIVFLDADRGEKVTEEVLEYFCKLPYAVPVVMLVNESDKSRLVEYIQMGAQDCLVKDKIPGDALWRVIRYSVERRKLEEQLHQAQKMESVGKLAGGVAHDFNNLLSIITGYTDLILEEKSASEKLRGYAEEVKDAGKRAVKLTSHLLAFSRHQMTDPQPTNISTLLNDLQKMLNRLLGADIEVSVISSENRDDFAMVDAGQLENVIINLAVNARDAMPNGGSFVVEITKVKFKNDYINRYDSAVTGDYIALVVSDTGSGMTPEVQQHLFEPFYTTKELGKGTGLGLATSYGAIKLMGGFISVYSEVNKGTTFRVYLPRIEPIDGETLVDVACEPIEGGSETILVVEDEPSLRRLTCKILTDQGYTVIDVSDGVAALNVIKSDKTGKIDMVVTDLVMPLMGGRQFSEEARLLVPNVKWLFVSGYTERLLSLKQMLDPRSAFLEKPFTKVDFLTQIRRTLDEAA